MFAVIFEVTPRPERTQDYLALAAGLRPELERISGFMSIERFASRSRPETLLSLSLWYNEKALIRWRPLAEHHAAQEAGRAEIFADYRLRVGEIVGDTNLPAAFRATGQRFDETEVGDAKAATITRADAGVSLPAGPAALIKAAGALDLEEFESITNPGKLLWLASWREAGAAAAWERKCRRGLVGVNGVRIFRLRIIRDYGLLDRREAPQYYPPVPKRI